MDRKYCETCDFWEQADWNPELGNCQMMATGNPNADFRRKTLITDLEEEGWNKEDHPLFTPSYFGCVQHSDFEDEDILAQTPDLEERLAATEDPNTKFLTFEEVFGHPVPEVEHGTDSGQTPQNNTGQD